MCADLHYETEYVVTSFKIKNLFTVLHLSLYFSPNIIRVTKSSIILWAGHVARRGEKRGAYRALVGTPEERRPLGRPRFRWEYNIKMDL
jgi:hypothetical protein